MVRHTGELPHTVTCPYGLTETAVPIKLAEKTVGYLRVGQVLRCGSHKKDIPRLSRLFERLRVPFSQGLRRAWQKNPCLPGERYEAIVRLLTFFAQQLSALGNQLMLERQNAEPPVVTKARAYIEDHKTEALSLGDVASAAGASVFHFCKVFHRSTGLKFSDYVARVRVEDARTKLLNPNLRVSEVAYDAGFQSLTQFNRTFKRVFGKSPTKFRSGLRPCNGKRAPG
jgi:AraC-like DNA-binding protein